MPHVSNTLSIDFFLSQQQIDSATGFNCLINNLLAIGWPILRLFFPREVTLDQNRHDTLSRQRSCFIQKLRPIPLRAAQPMKKDDAREGTSALWLHDVRLN